MRDSGRDGLSVSDYGRGRVSVMEGWSSVSEEIEKGWSKSQWGNLGGVELKLVRDYWRDGVTVSDWGNLGEVV